MKRRLLLFPVVLGATSALAAPGDTELADRYFSDRNLVLTSEERAALKIAQQWRTRAATGGPYQGPDGAIKFIYGSHPSIVCAPLQVCDVALQPGEQVNAISLGDTARWLVEPAITGSGSNAIEHVIIKPLDVGLETSLVVTTNRRAYHLRLRSHRTKYMPYIAFTYPRDALRKWNAIQARAAREYSNNTMPRGEYLKDLSFDYRLSGSARWKPTRVFNDGKKTIIEMSGTLAQTEAPALLVLRGGGLFGKGEEVLVNYRIQGNRYVVDTVFDKAILVTGVGWNQDRVTITRGGQGSGATNTAWTER